MGHMGVISFQNFLRGAQRDLPNRNSNELGISNDEEIAELYGKMVQYTSRYKIAVSSYLDRILWPIILLLLNIYYNYVFVLLNFRPQ